jgi:protocatechuate 3,4-dioxygenase beta subunit
MMLERMRCSRFLSPSLVLACLFAAAVCQARGQSHTAARIPSAPNATGFRISGIVVDALSGAALRKTRVSIVDTRNRGGAAWSMVTSEDGRFEFTNVYPGKFALQGDRRGYLSADYQQHEQFSTAIVTGPGLDSENLVLRLTPLASLHGTVTDESGEPVRQANVALYMQRYRAGFDNIVSVNREAADDQGSYEFPALAPGTYFLAVDASPWYAVHPPHFAPEGSTDPTPNVPRRLDVAYPTTFYNGATDSDAATPISLHGSDDLQVDVHLSPVPSLHLLLHAVEDPQRPSGIPWFQRHLFDSLEPAGTFDTQQISQGLYELDGLPAGKYYMLAPDAKTGRSQREGEITLSEDSQELEAPQVDAGARIKVTVKMPGNTPLPKPLFLSLQPTGVKGRIGGGGGQPDDAGEVVLENVLPGKYRIRAGAFGRAFSVLRFTQQGADVAGNTLEVSSAAPMDLTLQLVADTVSVEGYVKRKGKPAVGVMVALVPQDMDALERFRRDQTDSDGSFAVRSIAPGSYTIVAVDDAWDFPWQQPGVLARYVEHGQKLTIGELMTGSVQLPDPIEVQPR